MNSRNFILIILCVFALSGCSTTFIYNNLPWLADYWVDDYVDLDKQQSKQLKAEVEKLRRWHRSHALPQYRELLVEIKAALNKPLDVPQLLEWRETSQLYWQDVVRQANDPILGLAVSLSAQQKQEFVENVSKKISRQFSEFNELTKQEKVEVRVEQMLSSYKNWLGKLSDEQVSLIKEAALATASTKDHRFEYKQRRLDALRNVFTQTVLDEFEFREELTEIIVNTEQYKSDQFIALTAIDKHTHAALQAQILTTLSAKQQRHLIKEFNKWIDDIDTLIEDGD